MKRKRTPILDQRFADIGLPTRASNAVLRYFFYHKRKDWRDVTVRDALELSCDEYVDIRGLGIKGFEAICRKFAEYGLKFKEEVTA